MVSPAEKPRLAIVTGASSGIGEATAVELARLGWRVVLVARGRERLEAAAAKARATAAPGAEILVEAIDAADGDAVLAMAARVLATHGVPTAVVNSAGAGEWRFIEEAPPADGARMMKAPYTAAYNVTHAFMAPMLAKRRGTFVHVGSPASFIPWPGATAYVAARWALRGLHEALRMDLAGTGLMSCHVVLGKVTSSYFENNPGSEERIPGIGKLIPVMTSEQAGVIVARAVLRPRVEILRPWMLVAFRWSNALAPWLVRALIRATAARRSALPGVQSAQ